MFPVYGVKDVAGLHPGPEALAGAEALAGTECGRDARAPRQIRWGSRSRAAKLWPRPSPDYA